ncbi:MAG TPA: VanZ family protein, partial [Gemmatimonadaceae bacterium]|nr:VanZ family protein [Gemmatimonadaceae bacterium]
TLVPSSGAKRILVLCIWCGDQAGIDAFQNVLLYVPLGFALHRNGLRGRTAVSLCSALSVIIEAAQYCWIAGRYASIQDVITNMLGAFLGVVLSAHAKTLLAPGARVAQRLTLVIAAGLLALNGLTSWLLRPAFPEGPWWAQFAPPHRLYADRFHGTLYSARLAEAGLVGGSQVDAATVAAVRQSPEIGCELVSRIVTGEPTRGVAAITAIADEHNHVVAMLGQDKDAVVFRVRMRAEAAGFANPVFRASSLPAPGTATTIIGRLRDGQLAIEVQSPHGLTSNQLPLSSSWAWLFLLRHAPSGNSAIAAGTALWLFAILTIGSFWATRTGAPATVRKFRALLSLATAGALLLVPWIAGIPLSGWTEWTAAIAGLAVGALLATSYRHPRRTSEFVRRQSSRRRRGGVEASSSHQ